MATSKGKVRGEAPIREPDIPPPPPSVPPEPTPPIDPPPIPVPPPIKPPDRIPHEPPVIEPPPPPDSIPPGDPPPIGDPPQQPENAQTSARQTRRQNLRREEVTHPSMRRTDTDSAAALIPPASTLETLREAAAHCQACPLWQSGTQTVFGEGKRGAAALFVGEQPGDQEDRVGKPFVGPAGQLFDRALQAAEIERTQVYVTNVVKHFKWIARGSRRIHQSPNKGEVSACRPWLEAEIALIKPPVIVCLGAVAARALLGETFRVTRQRGQFVSSPLAPWIMATIHPSAILRIPEEEAREAAFLHFTADLKQIAAKITFSRSTVVEE